MINRIKKTSGVVRESADILSTRIRIDSLCMCACVCLLVWLNRTPISLPRGSLFSVLLCNIVPHRVKQRRDSPRRGSPSLFRFFPPNSLNRTLIAPRILADIRTDVHDIPRYYVDTETTSRVDRWIASTRYDREFGSASLPESHRRRKYGIVLQIIHTRQSPELSGIWRRFFSPESGDRHARLGRPVQRSPTRSSESSFFRWRTESN